MEGLSAFEHLIARKTVVSLSSFLHLKGLYLIAKLFPQENPLLQQENIDYVLNYLEEYTDLPLFKFWTSLTRKQQGDMCQSMSIRDDKEMNIMPANTAKAAEIYILLTGRATMVSKVIDGRRAPRSLPKGSVFGAVSLFCSEDEADLFIENNPVAVMHGSLLRIRYTDMLWIKYEHLRNIPVLTEEEIYYQDIKTGLEEHCSPTVVTLLKKHNLMPDCAAHPANKYKSFGPTGRTVKFRSSKEQEVIIVLRGSVRIVIDREFCKNETLDDDIDTDEIDVDHSGTIACKRNESALTYFKADTMPLTILEDGAVLCLDEDILKAASKAHKDGTDAHFHDVSSVASSSIWNKSTDGTNSNNSSRPMTPQSEGFPSNKYAKSSTNALMMKFLKGNAPKHVSILESLSMHFDKPTTYLKIPFRKLKTCLSNETHTVRKAIQKEFGIHCAGVAHRIELLKPWFNGSLIVSTMEVKKSAPEVKEDEDDVKKEKIKLTENPILESYQSKGLAGTFPKI